MQLSNYSNDYDEYEEDYGHMAGWFDDIKNAAQKYIFDPIGNALKPVAPQVVYNLVTGGQTPAVPPAPNVVQPDRPVNAGSGMSNLPSWVVPAGIGLFAVAILVPMLSRRR